VVLSGGIVRPVGELDLDYAPAMLAAIRETIAKAPRRIILDFGSLTFIDSCGCDVLVPAGREARAAGVRVALREDMIRIVRRVLAITGLLPMFEPA
jgi:anti-anti-sigma factor